MVKTQLKIVGQLCVGPGEGDRYLKEVLTDKSRFCDTIVVVGDGPIDTKTKRVAKSFPKVKYFQVEKSLFGEKQWLLKQTAQQLVIKESPDWILAFDADDIFEKDLTPEKFREILSGDDMSWSVIYVHLYRDRYHIRCDKWWENLRKVVLYHYDPRLSQAFIQKPMHCALVPKIYTTYPSVFPYLVEHLGYMNPKDIERKIERYAKYDPDGDYTAKGYYDSMSDEPTVKLYEPKKLRDELQHNRYIEWTEEKKNSMLNLLNNATKEKTYIVKNSTGRNVEVPEGLLQSVISRGCRLIREKEEGLTVGAIIETAPLVEKPEKYDDPKEFLCPVCQKSFPTEARMLSHKRLAHDLKKS